jgi:hypothetical protein
VVLLARRSLIALEADSAVTNFMARYDSGVNICCGTIGQTGRFDWNLSQDRQVRIERVIPVRATHIGH